MGRIDHTSARVRLKGFFVIAAALSVLLWVPGCASSRDARTGVSTEDLDVAHDALVSVFDKNQQSSGTREQRETRREGAAFVEKYVDALYIMPQGDDKAGVYAAYDIATKRLTILNRKPHGKEIMKICVLKTSKKGTLHVHCEKNPREYCMLFDIATRGTSNHHVLFVVTCK